MCRLSLGAAAILVVSIAMSAMFAEAGWFSTKKGKAVQNEEVEIERDLPKVEFVVDGVKYVVPIFNNTIQITDERLEYDRKTIKLMLGQVRKLLEVIFENKSYMQLAKESKKFASVLSQISEATKELKAKNPANSLPKNDGYGDKMKTMVNEIFNGKTEVKLRAEQAQERVDRLFKALEMVPVENTQTGLYVDYRKMKIGEEEESLVEHVAPVIKWIGSTSFYPVLAIAGVLTKFMSNF